MLRERCRRMEKDIFAHFAVPMYISGQSVYAPTYKDYPYAQRQDMLIIMVMAEHAAYDSSYYRQQGHHQKGRTYSEYPHCRRQKNSLSYSA